MNCNKIRTTALLLIFFTISNVPLTTECTFDPNFLLRNNITLNATHFCIPIESAGNITMLAPQDIGDTINHTVSVSVFCAITYLIVNTVFACMDSCLSDG